MQSILVKDYMNGSACAVKANASLYDVVKFLVHEGLTGAPVVDENNTLVGFISEQDCLSELLNEAFFEEEPKSVTNFMISSVRTVSPDTSIVQVAENMSKGPPKNYPVVENGTFVGIISRRSVMKALLDYNEGNYFHPKA